MDSIEQRNSSPAENAGESAEEYQRVRQLLLGGEQKQLNLLHHRLKEVQYLQQQLDERCQALQANELQLAERLSTIVQRGDEFVGVNLAAALRRRIEDGGQSREELVRALRGPVEESLRQSISEAPEELGETLGPVVGTEVNRGLRDVFQESGLQKLIRFREDGSARLAWPIALMISFLLVGLTGWLVFSIKENIGLERAAAILEGEPGIAVTATENPVLGKPRIAGLRDPLAPAVETLLSSAGLRPDNFTIEFQPFGSIDTPYAHQREQDRVRDLEDVRKQMIDAVGGLTSANETLRQRDLETFGRTLLALQFPEAKGKANLSLKEERWVLNGALEEPLYSRLTGRFSEITLPGGRVDFSGLENTTALNHEQVRAELEDVVLTFQPGTAEFSEETADQRERLVELIREFDAESAKLGRLPASFAVCAVSLASDGISDGEIETSRIEAVEKLLMKEAEIPVERILPGVLEAANESGRAGAHLEVIEPEK